MFNWRPVVGFEGFYEVSECGQFRSLDRVVKRGSNHLTLRGKIIKQYKTPPGGYLSVRLARDGLKKTIRVHSIVLQSFNGPRPDGFVACHNNGDIYDNQLSNLRWDSQSSNLYDTIAHGTNHHANKESCKRGHKFTLENTYVNPTSNGRQCRSCTRITQRASRKRLRAAAKIRNC